MILKDYIKSVSPDFSIDKCYGLVIATKELKPKASSVYGFVVTDIEGRIIFEKYFGNDVPDSSLAYDRLSRSDVVESRTFSDTYQELCDTVPSDSFMFSASAGTWAGRIFASIPEEFPTITTDSKFKHIDIIRFCSALDLDYLPSDGDLVKLAMRAPNGKRTSLDVFAANKGIRKKLDVSGTIERAHFISELMKMYFDKEIKES